MNEYKDSRITEDRLENAKRRKRKNSISSILVMFGCLIVLVLVTYAAGAAYMWIDDKFQENANDLAQAADMDLNGTITYSQNDLDEAVELAREEILEELQAEAYDEIYAEAYDEVYEEVREEVADEILTGIKDGLSEGDASMVEVLRPFYENELVVVSNGRFNFIPILEELEMHDHLEENLQVLENGEYQYMENGEVTSYKGIDVSKFQGDIDWEAVAADGVEFAFIRVGNRGYGAEGKMVADDRFEENVEGALDAGIKVGVYFYTQALNEEELLEEVEFVLEKIEPYEIECPVVYDVEKVSGADGRMNALSVEDRTYLTQLFCELIEEAGYQSMIYYNMEMATLMLNLEDLEGYDKWLAYYNRDFYYPYDYSIWQYTHNGRVDGIEGDVDMNIAFEPIWE